jgi:hypothetical protein
MGGWLRRVGELRFSTGYRALRIKNLFDCSCDIAQTSGVPVLSSAIPIQLCLTECRS